MGRNVQRFAMILVILGLPALAACEKKDEVSVKCQEVTLKVQSAAKCILNPVAADAEDIDIESLGYDPKTCSANDRYYRALGLTNNDAKQIAVDVNAFYETYKGVTFCAYLAPRLNQLDF